MRRKKLHRYPLEYWTMFRQASTTGKVSIKCLDTTEARRLREELYNFRSAIREAADELTELSSPRLLLYRARADLLTFSLEENGLVLTISRHVPTSTSEQP